MKYVKGFKIDQGKLRNLGYCPTEEDPSNMRDYIPIISLLPRTAYKYVSAGYEEDGETMCLVVVMADGREKMELEKMDMPSCKDPIPNVAKAVLTAGVWLGLE